MPSKIPTYTNPTKQQYTGVSLNTIDEEAREIYFRILAEGSPLSIEEEIDELIKKGFLGQLPVDNNPISKLDSLLIIEGVLELHAEVHSDSIMNNWYIQSVKQITLAIQVERINLKKLGIAKIPNIPKAHTHVAYIRKQVTSQMNIS